MMGTRGAIMLVMAAVLGMYWLYLYVYVYGRERMETTSMSRAVTRSVLVLDLDETLVHTPDGGATVMRPHVAVFLRGVAEVFDEVVLFTAGLAEYADPIVDRLEALSGVRIRRRYYRESCDFEPHVVKDLRVLGEPPSTRVFLVDNTPTAYSRQPESGIRIRGFYGEADDAELPKLLHTLHTHMTSEYV